MKITIDKRFKAKLQGRFGKYDLEVGVLQDGPHREPREGDKKAIIGTYAGGPVRKTGRKVSGSSIAQVSKENRERLGFNYLSKPFEETSSDIQKFVKVFFRMAFGASEKKRCENLLQAIVRNPILRGEYPTESVFTVIHKGFSRPMIDTAQLFKALRARVKVRSGRVR